MYLRSVAENPRREPANLAESFPGAAAACLTMPCSLRIPLSLPLLLLLRRQTEPSSGALLRVCLLVCSGLARELAVPPVYPEESFFASVLRISSPGLTLWCAPPPPGRQHGADNSACVCLLIFRGLGAGHTTTRWTTY